MKRLLALAALIASGSSSLFGQGAPINGTAQLRLTPNASAIATGNAVTVTLGVDLTGVTGQGPSGSTPAVLGGYQIVVAFDKARLRFDSAAGGDAPFNNAPTFTTPSSANSAGSVTLVASQTSSTSPTGNALVATLSFTSLASGSASLSASANSLSSAFQPPSFGPASIPSSGTSTSITIADALSTPTNPTPADGAAGVNAPVSLSWSAVAGASSYDVYFDTNTTPALATTVTAASATMNAVNGTRYYWRVVAKSATGNASGPVWTFTTSGTPPCQSPASPTLNAPTSASSGTPFTLTWASVANATEYSLEESTDLTFNAPTRTTISTPAVQTSITKTVTSDTTFYYRMLARNAAPGCSFASNFSPVVAVIVKAPATPQSQRRILLVIGSVDGQFNSHFRTALQLHNLSTQPVSGRIVFHAAATAGADTDLGVNYTLGAGETRAWLDLLGTLGASGIGSGDILSTDPLPAGFVRIFNDGGVQGTTGAAIEIFRPEDALHTGDSTVLFAPADPSAFRFNIGVRALDVPVTMNILVQNAQGATVKTLTRQFPAQYFVQMSDAQFTDSAAHLSANDTVTITVTAGNAIVYGATTDNTSQDPAVQVGRRAVP